MARVFDPTNDTAYEALIAEVNATVVNPATGTSHKVFAGKPIPGGLEQAYEVAVKDQKQKAKPKPASE